MGSFQSNFYEDCTVDENLLVLKIGKTQYDIINAVSSTEQIKRIIETKTDGEYDFDIEVKVVSLSNEVYILEVEYLKRYAGDVRELVERIRDRLEFFGYLNADWSIDSLWELLN